MKKHKCKFHAVCEVQDSKALNVGDKDWPHFMLIPNGNKYCKFVCEICGKVKYVEEQEGKK